MNFLADIDTSFLTWFAPASVTYHDSNVLSFAFIVLFIGLGVAMVSGGVTILGWVLNYLARKHQLEKKIWVLLLGYRIVSSIIFIVWTFLIGMCINFFLVAPTYGTSWLGVLLMPIFWTICLLILYRDDKFHLEYPKDNLDEEKPRWEEILVNNIFNSLWIGVKNSPYSFFTLLIGLFLASLIFNVTFSNLGIAYYPMELSTSFSRKVLQVGKVCSFDTICFDYLTVPEDLTTQMIVNFQYVGNQPQLANVTFWRSDLIASTNVTATCFDPQNPDEDRYHCWADLTNLTPGSTYYYFILVQGNSLLQTTTQKFRTSADSNANFVAGGDLSWSDEGIALSQYAAKQEFTFAMVMGDLAYDNGDINSYQRWDQWFRNWKNIMKTPSNFTIPILSGIGNHETGGFKKARYWDSYYTKYFPHQTNITRINPVDRKNYHIHKLASHSIVIVLDSWAHDSPESQVVWLNRTLAGSSSYKNKFAAYHCAIYPFKDISAEPESVEITGLLNTLWKPLFDAYSVTAAFENHFHGYKKTRKLKNDMPSPTGTYYLGDGSWGVPPSKAALNTQKVFDSQVPLTNYFFVFPTVTTTRFQGIVYNKTIQILDDFTS